MSAHLCVAEQWSPVTVENISSGGLFILTEESLPIGMPVAVNLARQGWTRVLRLTGRVVGSTGGRNNIEPGMRVKFDPLPKDVAGQLVKLLAELGAPGAQPLLIRAGTADHPELAAEQNGDTTQKSVGSFRGQVEDEGREWNPQTVAIDRTLLQEQATPVTPAHASAPDVTQLSVPALLVPARKETAQTARAEEQLLAQVEELRQALASKEAEIAELKTLLASKDEQLARAEKERSAAELALQRLSMQLAATRR